MSYPLVSVIIPVYQAENFVTECIRSVQAQNYPELEIIFSRIMARLFPCSAREWIRMRLAAVMDVSAEEKKADNSTRISMVTACIGTLESKLYSLLFYVLKRIYMIQA